VKSNNFASGMLQASIYGPWNTVPAYFNPGISHDPESNWAKLRHSVQLMDIHPQLNFHQNCTNNVNRCMARQTSGTMLFGHHSQMRRPK